MNRCYLIIAVIVLLCSSAGGRAQTLAMNQAAAAFSFSASTAHPILADRPVHGYSARKDRVANRLLIAGGTSLLVGVPLLIYGIVAIQRQDPGSVEPGSYHNPVVVGAVGFGAILTATGVGLTIPGSIVKLHNNARRRSFAD